MKPSNPPTPATVASLLTPGRWHCPVCGRPAGVTVTAHVVATGQATGRVVFDCGHPELVVAIKRGQK